MLSEPFLAATEDDVKRFVKLQNLCCELQMCPHDGMNSDAEEFLGLAFNLYWRCFKELFGEPLDSGFSYYERATSATQFFSELNLTLTFPFHTVEEFVSIFGRKRIDEYLEWFSFDEEYDVEFEGMVDYVSCCRLTYNGSSATPELNAFFEDESMFDVSFGFVYGKAFNEEERYVEFFISQMPLDQNGYSYGMELGEVTGVLFLLLNASALLEYARKELGNEQ